MIPPAPEREMADALRALAMDAVQAANSGHPGMPMGMAEIAVALWHRNLSHNPANPAWPNRDRFVLSNGHGSMLLYALLHLTGYDLPMAELKRFRQLGSKTPGHPEFGCAPGVETTPGPPTLICAKTVIGRGAPTRATPGSAQGAPRGEKEGGATREAIGGKSPPFEIPDGIRRGWDARERGKRAERRWKRLFAEYEKAHPEQAKEFLRRISGDLPLDFQEKLKNLIGETTQKAETIATRKASQNALEVLVPILPELVGGSADLTGSNLTMVKASKVVGKTDASVGQNTGGGELLLFCARALQPWAGAERLA